MFLSPCLCRVGFEVALLGVVFEQDATGGKCRDQTRKRRASVRGVQHDLPVADRRADFFG